MIHGNSQQRPHPGPLLLLLSASIAANTQRCRRYQPTGGDTDQCQDSGLDFHRKGSISAVCEHRLSAGAQAPPECGAWGVAGSAIRRIRGEDPPMSKVVPSHTGSSRKPATAKRAAKKKTSKSKAAGTSAAATPPASRGSKTAACLGLLRRTSGASLPELMAATGWQAHSVRGFLSGTVRRKMGLTLVAEDGSDGVRRYRVTGA